MKRLVLVALTILAFCSFEVIAPNETQASCVCACVNGEKVPLCTSDLDLEPFCMGMCPFSGNTSMEPLDSPKLEPLGTTSCSQERVYNYWTEQYEWKRVCY